MTTEIDLFSVDLTFSEIQLLRSSLDVITITGKSAGFVSALQMKLDSEINQIIDMVNVAQRTKEEELLELLESESKVTSTKKPK